MLSESEALAARPQVPKSWHDEYWSEPRQLFVQRDVLELRGGPAGPDSETLCDENRLGIELPRVCLGVKAMLNQQAGRASPCSVWRAGEHRSLAGHPGRLAEINA